MVAIILENPSKIKKDVGTVCFPGFTFLPWSWLKKKQRTNFSNHSEKTYFSN